MLGRKSKINTCQQKKGCGYLSLYSETSQKFLVDPRRLMYCGDLISSCKVLKKGYRVGGNKKEGLQGICENRHPYAPASSDYKGIVPSIRDLINEGWRSIAEKESGEILKKNEVKEKFHDDISEGLYDDEMGSDSETGGEDKKEVEEMTIPVEKNEIKVQKRSEIIDLCDEGNDDDDDDDIDFDIFNISSDKTPKKVPGTGFFNSQLSPKKSFRVESLPKNSSNQTGERKTRVESLPKSSSNQFGGEFAIVDVKKKSILNIRPVPSIGNIIALNCSSEFLLGKVKVVKKIPNHKNFMCLVLSKEGIDEYNGNVHNSSMLNIISNAKEIWVFGDVSELKEVTLFAVPEAQVTDLGYEEDYLKVMSILFGCVNEKIEPGVKNVVEFAFLFEKGFSRLSSDFVTLVQKIFRKKFDPTCLNIIIELVQFGENEAISSLKNICTTYESQKSKPLLSFTPILKLFTQKYFGKVPFLRDLLFKIYQELLKGDKLLSVVTEEVLKMHKLYQDLVQGLCERVAFLQHVPRNAEIILSLFEGIAQFDLGVHVNIDWGVLLEFNSIGLPQSGRFWNSRTDLCQKYSQFRRKLIEKYFPRNEFIGGNVSVSNIPNFELSSRKTFTVLFINNAEDFRYCFGFPCTDFDCIGVFNSGSGERSLPDGYMTCSSKELTFFASSSKLLFSIFQGVDNCSILLKKIAGTEIIPKEKKLVIYSDLEHIEEIREISKYRRIILQRNFIDFKEVLSTLKEKEKLSHYFSISEGVDDTGWKEKAMAEIADLERRKKELISEKKKNILLVNDFFLKIQNVKKRINEISQTEHEIFQKCKSLHDLVGENKNQPEEEEKKRIAHEKREEEKRKEIERKKVEEEQKRIAHEKREEEKRKEIERKKVEEEKRRIAREKREEEKRKEIERKKVEEEKRRIAREKLEEEKRKEIERKKVEEEKRRIAREKREEEKRRIAREKREEEQRRIAHEKREEEKRKEIERKKVEEEKRRIAREKREEEKRKEIDREKLEEEKTREKREEEKRKEIDREKLEVEKRRKAHEEEKRKFDAEKESITRHIEREKRGVSQNYLSDMYQNREREMEPVRMETKSIVPLDTKKTFRKRKDRNFKEATEERPLKIQKKIEPTIIRIDFNNSSVNPYCIDCFDMIEKLDLIKCVECYQYLHPYCNKNEEEGEPPLCKTCFELKK